MCGSVFLGIHCLCFADGIVSKESNAFKISMSSMKPIWFWHFWSRGRTSGDSVPRYYTPLQFWNRHHRRSVSSDRIGGLSVWDQCRMVPPGTFFGSLSVSIRVACHSVYDLYSPAFQGLCAETEIPAFWLSRNSPRRQIVLHAVFLEWVDIACIQDCIYKWL